MVEGAPDAPPAWVAEVVDRTADAETLTITAPGEAGVVVVVLARLSDDDRVEIAGVGAAAAWEAWGVFSSGLAGVSPERDGVLTVAGIQAGIIDYVGQEFSSSLISVIGDATGATIASIAVEGRADEIRAGLEAVVSSFAFLSSAGSSAGNPLAPGAGAGNPLAPAAGNPLAPAAGAAPTRNPLVPPAADASAPPAANEATLLANRATANRSLAPTRAARSAASWTSAPTEPGPAR